MAVRKYYGLDTDTTLGGNSPSDVVVSSQKALKTYIDNNSGGLPSQTGQSGKFLTTNGTSASWATVSGGATLTYDSTTETLTIT